MKGRCMQRPFIEKSSLPVRSAQAFAAFCPTSLQYRVSTARSHALAKTVSFQFAALIRLIGSFWHIILII